jgi:hypothetical protein
MGSCFFVHRTILLTLQYYYESLHKLCAIESDIVNIQRLIASIQIELLV